MDTRQTSEIRDNRQPAPEGQPRGASATPPRARPGSTNAAAASGSIATVARPGIAVAELGMRWREWHSPPGRPHLPTSHPSASPPPDAASVTSRLTSDVCAETAVRKIPKTSIPITATARPTSVRFETTVRPQCWRAKGVVRLKDEPSHIKQEGREEQKRRPQDDAPHCKPFAKRRALYMVEFDRGVCKITLGTATGCSAPSACTYACLFSSS